MSPPRLTVAVLLFNARKNVGDLVRTVLGQTAPGGRPAAEWMEVIFADDASTDGTLEELRNVLEGAGRPAHVRIIAHERNVGLAATLNEILGETRTPYLLTCHCDCHFDHPDYAWRMAALLDRHPDVAAITGQQVVRPGVRLPFPERLNLIANLMDVLPEASADELVTVGFAEGRCDAFRVEALRAAGAYEPRLRIAGEDQVLAARLRALGFRVCRAPDLKYVLSVSDTQDTVWKIVRKQALWGRVQPYLILRVKGAGQGAWGRESGRNRRLRSALRMSHLLGALVYVGSAAALAAGLPAAAPAAALGSFLLLKGLIYRRHVRAVGLAPAELLAFLALQPALDLTYAAGFVWGLGYAVSRTTRPLG